MDPFQGGYSDTGGDDWPDDVTQEVQQDPSSSPIDIGLQEEVSVTASPLPDVVIAQQGIPPWLLRLGAGLVVGGAVYAMTRGKNRVAYAGAAGALAALVAPALLARLRGTLGG